jgi:hypothetical protein
MILTVGGMRFGITTDYFNNLLIRSVCGRQTVSILLRIKSLAEGGLLSNCPLQTILFMILM